MTKHTIRTLSVRQPWATLIIRGLKTIENRSWATPYRGTLAIHASKAPNDPSVLDLLREERILTHRQYIRALCLPYPIGAVLGTVELYQIEDGAEWFKPKLPRWAEATSQFWWCLRNAKAFDIPLIARGALNLWPWTPPANLEI